MKIYQLEKSPKIAHRLYMSGRVGEETAVDAALQLASQAPDLLALRQEYKEDGQFILLPGNELGLAPSNFIPQVE
jgi:hypothetical protein